MSNVNVTPAESEAPTINRNNEDPNADDNNKHEAAANAQHLFHFTGWKAGTEMSGRKKADVNKLIYEMSKDSKYFKRAQENDKKTQDRIAEIRQKIKITTDANLRSAKAFVDEYLSEMDASRDLTQIFCVVDMDMFYAAVEIRDRPELKNKPVAVGGMSMISTANYEARKYGVRSAMPGFIAKKLCPHLVFVNTNFTKYKKVAEEFRQIFREYDPNFKSMSLDEAVLNITAYVDKQVELLKAPSRSSKALVRQRYSEASGIVKTLRERVYQKTKLTCSAGIGPSKLVAKIASDFNKPNGQHVVTGDKRSVISFLRKLPIRKVQGIGKVTEKILQDAFNVQTVQDIYDTRYLIYHLFTPISAKYLIRVSIGCTNGSKSNKDEDSSASTKSISMERTFREMKEFSAMCEKLHEIAHSLADQCKTKKFKGKTVTVKLKSSNFEVRNKQVSVANYVGWKGEEMFNIALPLMRSLQPKSLRLMGIRLSGLLQTDENGKIEKKSGCVSNSRNNISKFLQPRNQEKKKDPNENENLPCPICGKSLSRALGNSKINEHVDKCISGSKFAPSPDQNLSNYSPPPGKRKTSNHQEIFKGMSCPICAKVLPESLGNEKINEHVDMCLNNGVLKNLGESNCEVLSKKKPKRSLDDYF